MNAIEKKKLLEIKAYLIDFESQLKTEEMKVKERRLLQKAYEEKEYLERLRI